MSTYFCNGGSTLYYLLSHILDNTMINIFKVFKVLSIYVFVLYSSYTF